MKLLAVTGGIGSGKSYVIGLFSAMGVPVYHADARTKELYMEIPRLLSSLQLLLGDDIVKGGVLDRPLMAARLFGDRKLLEQVESVVFPFVLEDIEKWKRETAKALPPFAIVESAIFLEKPIFRNTADKVLSISAPLELRIKRVIARDNVPRESVLKRIKCQWTDERRAQMSDFVIVTDGIVPLMPQVTRIFNLMK